jgi:hypothetical protein
MDENAISGQILGASCERENISWLTMQKADISAANASSQKTGWQHASPECSVYRRYKVRG